LPASIAHIKPAALAPMMRTSVLLGLGGMLFFCGFIGL